VLGLATGPNYKSELGTIMQGWKKLKGGTGNNFDCLAVPRKKWVNRNILPKNCINGDIFTKKSA
jgi:hypothetical protein